MIQKVCFSQKRCENLASIDARTEKLILKSDQSNIDAENSKQSKIDEKNLDPKHYLQQS